MAKEKRVPTSFALPPSVVRDLRNLAERENRSTSRELEVAIRRHLATVRHTSEVV